MSEATKTKVVVYDQETIEDVLTTLDKDLPVVGIDAMRKVVEVFDALRTNGNIQEAIKAEDGSAISPELYQGSTEEDAPESNVIAPTFGNNEQVMYDAEAEEVPAVEEVPAENACEDACENSCDDSCEDKREKLCVASFENDYDD